MSYGSLKKISVQIKDKKLLVDTESSPDVDPAMAGDTIKRFNQFLGNATGYTSKQRRKKMTDAVKK